MDVERFVSVVKITADKEIREEAVEERKVTQHMPRLVQEIPQHSQRIREDDWFVWLDVVPRIPSYVPPGSVKVSCVVLQLQNNQLLCFSDAFP